MNFCWKTILCIYIIVLGPTSAEDKWSDDFSTSELGPGLITSS